MLKGFYIGPALLITFLRRKNVLEFLMIAHIGNGAFDSPP